ncbi:MAG: glucokinase [Parvibaculales bacterium]
MILVGDIGGTNARFAIAIEAAGKKIVISDYEKFKSRDFPDFSDLVQSFIDSIDHKPGKAILAVAGPVNSGKVGFTNQQWQIDSTTLEQKCKIPSVKLINDFEAMARSVPEISPDNFIEINPGTAVADAPMLVAGPGTGFGACTLVSQNGKWTPLSSEGGHSLYAPQNDLEKDIVSILGRNGERVSIERICAGKGLSDLTKAVCELQGYDYVDLSPHEMVERSCAGEEPFNTVSRVRANAIMNGLANMALVTGARGGVVIAGGVAKHLVNFLTTEEALTNFTTVWADNDYLKTIPIRLLIDGTAPLVGAAAYGFFDQEN